MHSELTDVPFLFSNQPLQWTVDNVLTSAECTELICKLEGAKTAVVAGDGEYRNQDRLTWDSAPQASLLLSRLKPHLPQSMGALQLDCLTSRFRLYRYKPGQAFAPHTDHWHQYDMRRISLLTVLVYLNEGFKGGETRFLSPIQTCVVPRTGQAAIWQHKVEHEGCPVLQGVKYALRTDAVYRADYPVNVLAGCPTKS